MPDHFHLIFIGLDDRADQIAGVRYLRGKLNQLLQPFCLQDQAYDNVLREDDRAHSAFPDVVGYVLNNPVRKGLADKWDNWPYSGTVFPGYSELDPRKHYFWENFWAAYQNQALAP